jgi:bifunctional NMN adenylyltransferase/nudix hydrolase
MKIKNQDADVGVLVARFQVDELHEAHCSLIEGVLENHGKTIIFLGLSPIKCTRNNPLDFEARKQMVLEKYPDAIVLYIKDVGDSELWSKMLDKAIGDIAGPTSTVILYGGRESFINHYHGKYETCEMLQEVYQSGSETRRKVGNKVKSSSDFRSGVLWATHNQYPKIIPSVDMAIWGEDKDLLLMGKWENSDKYRFIGGIVKESNSFDVEIEKVVYKKACVKVSEPIYVGSFSVDDWRFRRELDGVTTTFFEAVHMSGTPDPMDNVVKLKWFEANMISTRDIDKDHWPLLDALRKKHPDKMGKIDPPENQNMSSFKV